MASRDPTVLGILVREKGLEMLVQAENLAILASAEGVAAFGALCELVGRCCQHVAAGRPEAAREALASVGNALVRALPEGREREALEDDVEEILAILDDPDPRSLH